MMKRDNVFCFDGRRKESRTVSRERLALWGRRTVVRTYLPKGVWTVALSEKDELVPFANEALRLVEVDGEASVT